MEPGIRPCNLMVGAVTACNEIQSYPALTSALQLFERSVS